MAETSSSEEKPKAEKDSPRNRSPALATGGARAVLTSCARAVNVSRRGRAARSGEAFHTKHFTLYARFASTKKQELHLAFGTRAGPATARNRAKRQAREAFRYNRRTLATNIEVVIACKGDISALPPRSIRAQLEELFARACARLPHVVVAPTAR